MKLSLDALVLRLTHEDIANFSFLHDFDKKSIDNFPTVFKNSIPSIEEDATNRILAENSVAGANISSISLSSSLQPSTLLTIMDSLPGQSIPKTRDVQVSWNHSRSSMRLVFPLRMMMTRRSWRSMIETTIKMLLVGLSSSRTSSQTPMDRVDHSFASFVAPLLLMRLWNYS